MCGIVGIYNYRNAEPVAERTIRTMLAAVAHRGPDDQGVFLHGSLALGHRRLSILDTSSAGHQPMVSPSGRAVLTYNGEIDNYLELAASLPATMHRFRSRSDTEVILAQYEAQGEKCLQDFIGMFAFALWDTPRQRLILGSGPAWDQAALLDPYQGRHRFCLGDQGAIDGIGRAASCEHLGNRALYAFRLCCW